MNMDKFPCRQNELNEYVWAVRRMPAAPAPSYFMCTKIVGRCIILRNMIIKMFVFNRVLE